MFTVNVVQQLMFRTACTEMTVSQHLVCLTGNGAYCYIQYMWAHTSTESHNIQLQTHKICTHHNTTNTVTYNIM